MMKTWIALDYGWSLQNVQAAINVIIAFLCAGGIFVLVRQFWVASARKVTQSKEVPAYSLLSLNTIGEILDIIFLLRKDLLTSAYRGLLIQCIFVLFLTACALTSGFIARFSTRNSVIVVQRNVTGNRVQPNDIISSYSVLELNNAMTNLQKANFGQNELVDFWPNPASEWEYDAEQWKNASWSMNCVYNESVPYPNPYSSGDCSGQLWSLFPQLQTNWEDWTTYDNVDNWSYNSGGWYRNISVDWLMWTHGYRWLDSRTNDKTNATEILSMQIRTVATYIQGAPPVPASEKNSTSCFFSKGPVNNAFYTSATCNLTRHFSDDQQKDGSDYWRAWPDYYASVDVAESYNQYYASRFQRESASKIPVSVVGGPELVNYFQAWLITRDTGGFLYDNSTNSTTREIGRGSRNLDVRRTVAHVHVACLIVCSVGLFIILIGLIYYWVFLWLNWHRLNRTPQSKLDWMLQTIRREHEEDSHAQIRHKLRNSMAPGVRGSEVVPLTDIERQDHKEFKSARTSVATMNDVEIVDSYDSPGQVSNFSGSTFSPVSVWSPYQRQRVGTATYDGLGVSNRGNYNQLQASGPWDTPGFDTAYDPGRR